MGEARHWYRGEDLNTGHGIAVDWQGNSYVAGQFADAITFGTGEPNEVTLTATSPLTLRDSFIAKFDRRGALMWARQADTAVDGARAVGVDSDGNSYVTGTFFNSVTFGRGEENEITLISGNGVPPGFVAKYGRHGEILWARLGGGFGISVDERHSAYVTGTFEGTATFGVGEPHETVLTSSGPRDLFVAKYSKDDAGIEPARAHPSTWRSSQNRDHQENAEEFRNSPRPVP